ncbi:hypothetical protein BC829DRAFT_2824 [Chytridium lagenaria]|nr:hypothetical protein BC829DRAFT_2824 [Chytridium lagenaria]
MSLQRSSSQPYRTTSNGERRLRRTYSASDIFHIAPDTTFDKELVLPQDGGTDSMSVGEPNGHLAEDMSGLHSPPRSLRSFKQSSPLPRTIAPLHHKLKDISERILKENRRVARTQAAETFEELFNILQPSTVRVRRDVRDYEFFSLNIHRHVENRPKLIQHMAMRHRRLRDKRLHLETGVSREIRDLEEEDGEVGAKVKTAEGN